MSLYNEILEDFRQHGAQLLGLSVDGVWCHRAFAEARKLHFPLLADFEPKGEVASAFGVYRTGDGTSERALFVLDGAGVVRWSYVSPLGVNPGADGILEAVAFRFRGRSPFGTRRRPRHACRVRGFRVPELRRRLPVR
jgi:peroxiredoxin